VRVRREAVAAGVTAAPHHADAILGFDGALDVTEPEVRAWFACGAVMASGGRVEVGRWWACGGHRRARRRPTAPDQCRALGRHRFRARCTLGRVGKRGRTLGVCEVRGSGDSRLGRRAAGSTLLFPGPSGTGKTMAREVIAARLALPSKRYRARPARDRRPTPLSGSG
jgi:hypothetical protein